MNDSMKQKIAEVLVRLSHNTDATEEKIMYRVIGHRVEDGAFQSANQVASDLTPEASADMFSALYSARIPSEAIQEIF